MNSRCVVGASGEISDFQQLQKYLEELTLEDFNANDGIAFTPKQVHSYLTRILYNRRTKCASCPLKKHASSGPLVAASGEPRQLPEATAWAPEHCQTLYSYNEGIVPEHSTVGS